MAGWAEVNRGACSGEANLSGAQAGVPVPLKLPTPILQVRRGLDGADGDGRWVDVVAVLAHGLFGGGAELLVGGGLRYIAVTTHHFVAGLDANEPFGF
jgi:hypothetical protein